MRILNEELVKYSIIKPVDLRAMSLVSALLNNLAIQAVHISALSKRWFQYVAQLRGAHIRPFNPYSIDFES